MGVRKDSLKNGKWLAEAFIKGKRVRRWFETKAEASRFFNELKRQNSPLADLVAVRRENPQRLSELVELWFDLHGQTLSTGLKIRSCLLWACEVMGDPLARNFTLDDFSDYRKKRLNGLVNPSAKITTAPTESTLNNELLRFKAVFNELKRLNKWKGENPLDNMRRFKIKQNELYFLRHEEIERLLDVVKNPCFSPDLGVIIRICLATGARWSEAEDLTGAQVIPYRVTYTKTKTGKNRTVPISPELFELLPKKSGRLFKSVYHQFAKAINMAGIKLPKNQLTHVLRHTFASHFMMNGGNIIVLRDILGHSDIKMTMTYSHFAPSHLEAAVAFNPLANLHK